MGRPTVTKKRSAAEPEALFVTPMLLDETQARKPMTGENHPQYQAWNEALERMMEAERRYYAAVMEGRPNDEMQSVARDLDEARARYRKIADEIG